MTELWEAYCKVVAQTKILPNNIKAWVIAQRILESLRGTTVLATDLLNFGGMKRKPELDYLAHGYRKIDGYDYAHFWFLEEEIEYYWVLIHRKEYYPDVDKHLEDGEDFINYIGPHYCPPGYVGSPSHAKWVKDTGFQTYTDYLRSLLPEATRQLQKYGWNLDVSGTPNPVPHPMPPTSSGDFEFHDGFLYIGGQQVPYFETPLYAKGEFNNSREMMIHYAAARGFDGIIKAMQNPTNPGAAHFEIGAEGQIAQLASINRVVYHSGDVTHNRDAFGVELEGWGSSRMAILDQVVFWRWHPTGRRMELVPKADCLYAPHYKEPKIWRWWPYFTDAQYVTLRKLRKAWEKSKGYMLGTGKVIGHEEVVQDRLDPGPAFNKRELEYGY